jgi:hypothetical protein
MTPNSNTKMTKRSRGHPLTTKDSSDKDLSDWDKSKEGVCIGENHPVWCHGHRSALRHYDQAYGSESARSCPRFKVSEAFLARKGHRDNQLPR